MENQTLDHVDLTGAELADFDFDFDELTALPASSEYVSAVSKTTNKIKPAKSKGTIKPPRRAKILRTSVEAAVTTQSTSQPIPNMSRRRRYENTIVAFPSFDKCDSLIYFPSTFTRHLNNGDLPSLWKLFTAHMDKNCVTVMTDCYYTKDRQLTPYLFLKTYELLNEMQPDRIMCVNDTKVDENRIHASIHMKLTDSKFLNDSALRSNKVPELKHSEPVDRRVCLRYKINSMKKSQDIIDSYHALVDAEVDLLLYVHMFMDITFDNTTRRIKSINFSSDLTSMHALESRVELGSL